MIIVGQLMTLVQEIPMLSLMVQDEIVISCTTDPVRTTQTALFFQFNILKEP